MSSTVPHTPGQAVHEVQRAGFSFGSNLQRL